MIIYGCKCLNILIHVEKVLSTHDISDYLNVELTFNGISVQRDFLISSAFDGPWEETTCKVCNQIIYKKDKQHIQISPHLIDYTATVLEVQTKDSFSKSYNLILPATAPSCPPVNSALPDLEELRVETENIKNEMKSVSEERIAQFLKNEQNSLQLSLKKTEQDMCVLGGLINIFHNSHPPSTPAPQQVEQHASQQVEQSVSINKRTRTLSGKRVKFSDLAVSSSPPVDKHREEPKDEGDILFDMDEAFGDFDPDEFPTEPSDEEETNSEAESSSSGCEADMVSDRFGGQSVPINVPMNYEIPRRSRRASASHNKNEDLAHSMREAMAEFHDREQDVPRPRLSRSFSTNRHILR